LTGGNATGKKGEPQIRKEKSGGVLTRRIGDWRRNPARGGAKGSRRKAPSKKKKPDARGIEIRGLRRTVEEELQKYIRTTCGKSK